MDVAFRKLAPFLCTQPLLSFLCLSPLLVGTNRGKSCLQVLASKLSHCLSADLIPALIASLQFIIWMQQVIQAHILLLTLIKSRQSSDGDTDCALLSSRNCHSSVCYLYVFPVSSSVNRWLTGSFGLWTCSPSTLVCAHVILASVQVRRSRWLKRWCGWSCSTTSTYTWNLLSFVFFLLKGQFAILIGSSSWRCLFVLVLDTFHVKVCAHCWLACIFVFFVEHTERIYIRRRCARGSTNFCTTHFWLLKKSWALLSISLLHYLLLSLFL